MKRWFIARMVELEPNEIGPKVSLYPNVNFRIWSNETLGFCLGQLATNNLDQFSGDPDIKLIPDAAMDNALSSISTQTRNAMITQLTAAGFNVSAVKNTWTVRQLLRHLKLQISAGDSIESADVRDTF